MLIGVKSNSPIEAKGVMSIELTIGTRILVVAFFVVEVEGNYTIILDRDFMSINMFLLCYIKCYCNW